MDIITLLFVLPLALLPTVVLGVPEVVRVIRAGWRARYPRRAFSQPDAVATTPLAAELEHQELRG